MAGDENRALLNTLNAQLQPGMRPLELITRDDLLPTAQAEYDRLAAQSGGKPISIVLNANVEHPADLVNDVAVGEVGGKPVMMVGEYSHRWTAESQRASAPSDLDLVKLAPADDTIQEWADAIAAQDGGVAPKIYESQNGVTNTAVLTKEGNYAIVLKRGQSEEENRETILHERRHIANGDVEFANSAAIHNSQSFEVMRNVETLADRGISDAGYGADGVKIFQKLAAEDRATAEANGMTYDRTYQRLNDPTHPLLEDREATVKADAQLNRIIGSVPPDVLNGLKTVSGGVEMSENGRPLEGGGKAKGGQEVQGH